VIDDRQGVGQRTARRGTVSADNMDLPAGSGSLERSRALDAASPDPAKRRVAAIGHLPYKSGAALPM
jgi:hypothetical protein